MKNLEEMALWDDGPAEIGVQSVSSLIVVRSMN